MVISMNYTDKDIMIKQIKKRLGLLTLISSILYLAISVYYTCALIIANYVQKEKCPMGLLLLPIVVWPSLFIFLFKFYAGFQFLKNKYDFKKFIKYLILFFVTELSFFIIAYTTKALNVYWYAAIALLNIFYFLYTFLFFYYKKNILLSYEETKPFYLGFYLIIVSDIIFGIVFTAYFILDLLNIQSLWVKDLPVFFNILNFGKVVLTASMVIPCFWIAINISKFSNVIRRLQLIVSSLLIIEIATGSMFFTLLPIHIFSIWYLNTQHIKSLFIDREPVLRTNRPRL
jgi:hypothetical protein